MSVWDWALVYAVIISWSALLLAAAYPDVIMGGL